MKVVVLLIASLVASTAVFGGEEVLVPWEEFKSLYRDSIEREILKQAAPPKKEPQVHSVDEARYRLTVGTEDTQGEVLLSGRIVSGEPEPIPLFGQEAVITELKGVTGGTVLCAEDGNRTVFLPDGGVQEFQLIACFLVRPQEDNGTRVISFDIPYAVQNTLDLNLPPESRLLEHPGIADADGAYHFSATPCLTVKYLDGQDPRAAAILETIEIDAVSRISVQKNRIVINTFFLPLRIGTKSLILQAPQGARYLSSSLKASALKALESDRYQLNIPPTVREPFSFEVALDTAMDDDAISLALPAIEDNTGQQGRFVLEEPDEGQVTVTATGLVSQMSLERLGRALSETVGGSRFYMSVPANEKINLTINWFKAVRTPATVLDCQYLFTSFEENGNILSVLVMDIPPEAGARMKLKAVPEAEIWSLAVNGTKRQAYAGEQDTWLIPLESAQASHVELAFLRKGPKIGLQGKLDAVVPETGLASQNLRVGVALPARVELLFAEGPVNAAPGEGWKLPTEFVGKQYFFARSFYKGEGMKLSLSYKEPVNHARQQEGGAR